MKEAQVRSKVLKALREEDPRSSFDPIHGGPYQRAGLPDIVGCVNGGYMGFEVKLLKKIPLRASSDLFGSSYSFTVLQEQVAKEKIRAGGQVFGLTYMPENRLLLLSPVKHVLSLTVGEFQKEGGLFNEVIYPSSLTRYSWPFKLHGEEYIILRKKGKKFPILQALEEGYV